MNGNFAFLLPVIMATFGCAFLIVWRAGVPAAAAWSAGFLAAALAFACPMVLTDVADPVLAIVSDTLFAIAFLFYGQALLIHFGRRPSTVSSVLLCIAAVGASAVAVLGVASLRLELVVSDFACSLLVLVPLVRLRHAGRRPIDRALLGITALVILDNVARGSTAAFTTATDSLDAYMGSTYAFLEQASAATLGLLFGFTALAAMTLDVVERYRAEALTDPLTGLLNRRGFLEATQQAKTRTPRPGHVLTCDIDHFKRVNDTFGHATGDRVLVAFADILRQGLPEGAVAARFGGEEFIVYLPTPNGEARLLADMLRTSVSGHEWDSAGIDWLLTASFGLSGVHASDATIDDAIARADRGLYDAKAAGRNCVAIRPAA